jgi:hypothetical protein
MRPSEISETDSGRKVTTDDLNVKIMCALLLREARLDVRSCRVARRLIVMYSSLEL